MLPEREYFLCKVPFRSFTGQLPFLFPLFPLSIGFQLPLCVKCFYSFCFYSRFRNNKVQVPLPSCMFRLEGRSHSRRSSAPLQFFSSLCPIHLPYFIPGRSHSLWPTIFIIVSKLVGGVRQKLLYQYVLFGSGSTSFGSHSSIIL